MLPSPFARLFGMVSAPFVTAKHTVNNRGKLPKSGIVIRKLSFALDALSLSMATQFLRCRRRSSLVTAVRFLNGQEALSIDCYEMTLVKGKIACQKQIFEQGHVRRAETIRISALATLLYVDWLPQVNGPPGALLSSVVDHESAIIVNT